MHRVGMTARFQVGALPGLHIQLLSGRLEKRHVRALTSNWSGKQPIG